MATTYSGVGCTVDYTAGATISSGDVLVLGATGAVSVGVALTDIANGSIGAVAVDGVFTLTKLTGAVIVQGETVDWDLSGLAVDDNAMTPASGDVSDFGVAMVSACSGVLYIKVKLLPGNGAIT